MMAFYRLLLRLYPASFRHEYGPEMSAIFRDRWRAERGTLARLWMLLAACFEVAGNAAAVHADLLRQDVRHTLRAYRRAPAFALTAIAIIALGTGANTAVFSVADYVLLRPLPFPQSDQLVKLWEKRVGYSRMELSPPNYEDWSEQITTLQSWAPYTETAANLVGGEGRPRRLQGAVVGSGLFDTLGVRPALGRGFVPENDVVGSPPVAVLSHRLWQARFGGDRSLLGEVVQLDGRDHTVIGIMPPTFLFPNREVDYWAPLQIPEEDLLDRNNNFLKVVGRMHPGTDLAQVQAELDRIAARVEEENPVLNKDVGANVVALRQEFSQQARLLVLALAGAALCVLLITCINLANLLLARSLARRRELQVRAVMGAGRERLARQLLTESLVLAGAGGALGVGVAVASLPLLASMVPHNLPVDTRPSVDLTVLAFAGALTLLTGVAIGVLPALRIGRGGFSALAEHDRGGGGRREGLRSALVLAGIVCSVVLLVSAGLLLRALWRVQAVDPGFEPDQVLTLRVALPMPQYAQTEERVAWYQQVVDEIRALPGVDDAGFISFLPMTMTGGIWPVATEENAGRREGGSAASLRFATSGLLDTLQIPLLRGRGIEPSDRQDAPPVAVVSQSFVDRFFPDVPPLGERFEFAFQEREIVGVVGNVRVRGLERPSEPQVYLPAAQVPDGSLSFYVPKDLAIRSSINPEALTEVTRDIVARADPFQPVSNVRTLRQIVDAQTASRTGQLRVVVAFAVVALLLAAVGIHGLLSFLVSQRQREIGVRVALGAARPDILGLVLGRGAALAAGGLVVGALLAFGAARTLRALLAGVPPADVWTLGAVAVLCALMTLLGSLMPALRALRIDPAQAIRAD